MDSPVNSSLPGDESKGRSALLDAALAYAKLGVPVFPLWGTDGRGACGCPKRVCTSPGKHPRTEHGLSDATTEPFIIRAWWTRWPEANIGLRAGKVFVVLDPDDLQGALQEARAWGVDLDGFHSQTGKGRHYLFRPPAGVTLRNKAKAASSWPLRFCDARGEGGYIVAPPSLHPSGKRYTWSAPFDLAQLPEIPGGLLEVWRDPEDDPRNQDPLADAPDEEAVAAEAAAEATGGDGVGEVTAAYWTRRYIQQALRQGADRNPTGFLLALQLRDTGISRADAEAYARRYQQAVATCRAGKEDYDWLEMVGSLNQAYSQPPRTSAQPGDTHGKPKLSAVDVALLSFAPLFADSGLTADPTTEGAPAASLGMAAAEKFHDASGEVYITAPVDGHHETMRIHSGSLKRWLRWDYFERTGKTLTSQQVTEIIEQWAAEAQFKGPVREVAFRIWQPTDDTIWLDLGDDSHRAVRVTPDDWTVWDDPPVKFIRKKGCQPLPSPLRATTDEPPGRRLERLLRPYLNLAPPQEKRTIDGDLVTTDHDWVLLVSWLLATFCGRGPYPVLQLRGEKGSAKSTTGRVLRRLVDPHKVELEPQPGNLRDMAIAAQGTWLIAYDNLSHLTDPMSNALCRLSTGGGFRTRQLYSDDDEAMFAFMRPVVLTGIGGVVIKPDLLDRTLSLTLPFIPKKGRRAEKRFWRDFEADHPAILGAVLDLLRLALAALPDAATEGLPRMADFAHWARAVEVAMGWPNGTFAAAYGAAERDANTTALEGSPIGEALLYFLRRKREDNAWVDAEGQVAWKGTMSDLLAALNKVQKQLDEDNPNWKRDHPGWPSEPRGLSAKVAEITANLRAMRWDLRKVGQRSYVMRWLGEEMADEGGGDEGDVAADTGGGWGLRR